MIKAVINVESPRPHVYSILTDYPRYKDWLPGCAESTVLSKSGDTVDTEIVISSIKKMKLGLRFEAQPSQALNFRMISGKDIKAYSGSYRLMDSADGKGTVVIAEMELDAGAMVPKFMVDRMAKKSINDTGAALRNYVNRIPIQTSAIARPHWPGREAEVKPRRSKRLLQIARTSAGYRVWLMGETYDLKSK